MTNPYDDFRARLGVPSIGHDDVVISRGRVLADSRAPIGKDRFWLVGEAAGAGRDDRRPLLARYALYNADPQLNEDGTGRKVKDDHGKWVWAASTEQIEEVRVRRRELHGTLRAARWVSADDEEPSVVRHSLVNYRPDGEPVAPQSRPWCSSRDALTAERWTGQEWVTIPCPGDRCEWRQERRNAKGYPVTPCVRKLVFWMDLRWPEGPCPTCAGTGIRRGRECAACKGTGRFSWGLPPGTARLETAGSFSFATAKVLGFYDDFVAQWRAVGRIAGVDVGEPDFYGLPVRLELRRETVQARRAEVWVPMLSLDLPEGWTLQGWMLERVRVAQGAAPLLTGTIDPPRALPGPAVQDADYEVASVERGA